MPENQLRLQMKGISKVFPGVKALSNVNLRLFPGEVHALMGENGAGKSTLIKVLTGVYTIDEGNVWLDGKPISARSPLESQELGISTVYQEVNLCTNLSVAENIFIGREVLRRGRIDWKEIYRRAIKLLERLHLNIDVTKPLSSYSVAIQQMVAIARSLNISAKVLILDEPTSSLDKTEVQELFKVMNKLKSEGMAILFVTHFLDQVYEICDRMTILRNGELVGEFKTTELPKIDLVTKMIGKELQVLEQLPNTILKDKQTSHGAPFMQARQAGRKGSIEPFDFDIYKGEIVSFAGLLGSGRTEIAKLLFGADKADTGSIIINNKTIHLNSPSQAIHLGIAFCPENRKTESIIEDLTVRENIILAMQASMGWFKYISRKKQDGFITEFIQLLNVNPPNPEMLIKNLSGGNQQKVILARWLLTHPQFLILDEPTRGIDVGTKAEIQKLILSLSQEGMAILFISSELEEVIRCGQRILVLRDKRVIAEIKNDEINQQNIMQAIAGG
ncbi:MAG TPA: sugar ABC transporter ATP-binding protein [Bacilli bacterium]